MTDTVVHIAENSPESVAYRLLRDIADVEGRVFDRTPQNSRSPVDRKWILDTYRECLRAVKLIKAHTGS
jgi:hypothetical protein